MRIEPGEKRGRLTRVVDPWIISKHSVSLHAGVRISHDEVPGTVGIGHDETMRRVEVTTVGNQPGIADAPSLSICVDLAETELPHDVALEHEEPRVRTARRDGHHFIDPDTRLRAVDVQSPELSL